MSEKTIYAIIATILFVGAAGLLYILRDTRYVPSWDEHQGKLDALDEKMKKLLTEIQSAHGAGKCEATPECRVIGLGAKTCGGYNNYLIYSTHDADEASLIDLVHKYNETSEERNRTSLQAAPCGQPVRPIICVREECVPN